MIENIYHVYCRSTLSEQKDGMAYYERQRSRLEQLARRTGTTTEQAVGVYCALSPNNDEVGNYRDALTILASRGQDLDVKVSTYGANKRKAMRIALGEPPLHVLRGNKVRSFYINTINPSDPYHVTVDGHIANIWHGRPRNLVTSARLMTNRHYCEVSDGIRKAAGEIGILPRQLQSTIWITWKRIHGIRYTAQCVLFHIEEVNDWRTRIVLPTSQPSSGTLVQREPCSTNRAVLPDAFAVNGSGGEPGPAGSTGVPDQKVLQFEC